MSVKIASLNSGSNGNCYYVAAGGKAVLVDAGISCKETEKRMARIGLTMKDVQAIFISHEHSDHIRGLEVLSKKYQLPVYITPATLKNSKLNIHPDLVRTFNNDSFIQLEHLAIKPFSKLHDAADPYSFVVSAYGINIGVFTDIGACCHNVIRYFKECHAVFLEANYDTEMLETGMYPYYLKKRITGGHGHLSNHESLQLFTNHRSEAISHLILSHLSKDNNSPELVKQLFEQHAGSTKIVVASRHCETDLFEITAGAPDAASLAQTRANVYLAQPQLKLF
jgi:phosphoribosyl 1,2-cyclic phosphodiesterase